MAGASVPQLSARGEAGVPVRATRSAEDRGRVVAVGRVGGSSVHRPLQASYSTGPRTGHLPDYRG